MKTITSDGIMEAIQDSGAAGLSLSALVAWFEVGDQEQEDELRSALYNMRSEGRIYQECGLWVPDPNYEEA